MGINRLIPNREKDYTMHRTKMIKVHFPNWQFWIFSLTAYLLVLAMQPRSTVAQVNTAIRDGEETQRVRADRRRSDDWRRATSRPSLAVNPNSSQVQSANNTNANLEPKILSEINRVRTNPQAYAQWLEQQRQYYDGIWLKLPGEKPVRTNRGRKALEEAIAILKQQQPLPPLKTSERTAAAATSELNNFANAKNIQYFSYGRKTASGIVMDLVVDELFPDRRRRQSLLSPEAEDSGVVCKPDPRYAKICAIAYSNSPVIDSPNNTNVAFAKPEVIAPEAEVETTPEPQASESVRVVEVPVAPLEQNDSENTLPAPPIPQAPPTPSAPSEPEPRISEEVSQAEIESEIEEIARENQTSTEDEAEPEESPTDSSNESESEAFEESAEEFEEEKRERDVELDGEEAESSLEETESEEVAINTENIDFSEEGTLEEGDRVIAEDGSFYDFYPIEGKAGDSFTIYLESDDFDAFVALVDSNGETIGENDDISQEDSNSQIEVTLPEDGVYNVIVNTYDEDGTGKYVLTVSP